MNSNRKGKTFEREIAAYLREHGYTEARRGQQYKGGADSPDVVGLTQIERKDKTIERMRDLMKHYKAAYRTAYKLYQEARHDKLS